MPSLSTPPSDLANLAKEFTEWRNRHPRRVIFPVDLWRRAISLTGKYPVGMVASAIGFTKAYLKIKIEKFQAQGGKSDLPVEMPFVELGPRQPSHPLLNPVRARISQTGGPEMELAYSGSIADLTPLVKVLFEQKKPCSN